MNLDMEIFNIFSIDFHTGKTKGKISKDFNDDIILQINEFDIVLCQIEDFNEFVEIGTLEVGKIINIDGVDAIIDAIDIETHEESNLFWERVEMEEMNHL